jgi:hypothetical protein
MNPWIPACAGMTEEASGEAGADVSRDLLRRYDGGRLSVSDWLSMPSSTYGLFATAMAEGKQILCIYNGYRRELCPIILGHSQGQEKALTYQFAGQSESRLPPGGDWKCLFLAKVSDVQLRDGPWHAGDSHSQRQRCVEHVDIDVNPASPYNPKRRLRA